MAPRGVWLVRTKSDSDITYFSLLRPKSRPFTKAHERVSHLAGKCGSDRYQTPCSTNTSIAIATNRIVTYVIEKVKRRMDCDGVGFRPS